MSAAGITKLTPAHIAKAIELRTEGYSWVKVEMILGLAHATTWRDNVRKAELLGFKAWRGM